MAKKSRPWTADRDRLVAVQMAMLGHLPYQRMCDAVITHPTMAEGLNLLFDTVGQQVPG